MNDVDKDYLALLTATPVPMILSRVDGSFEFVNQALWEMLGYSESDIYSPKVIISHPDELSLNIDIREKLQRTPFTPIVVEKRYIHKTGEIIHAILTIVAQRDSKNSVKRFISQIVDISDRHLTEQKLKLASLVYRNSDEGMLITDERGVIIDSNPAFTATSGYGKKELVGNEIQLLNCASNELSLAQIITTALDKKGRWKGEIWIKRKDEGRYPCFVSINIDISTGPTKRVVLLTDLSLLKASESRVARLAYFDTLTSLPNRNMFFDRLAQQIKHSHREQTRFALFLLDLDGFKNVNDTHGHELGDCLLKMVADRLTQRLREHDTIARMGGDEFTIVVSGANDQGNISQLGDDILATLSQPFSLGDQQIFVSASIGISLYPDDSVAASTLLRNADLSMYTAKRQGGNRYCYFTPAMNDHAQYRSRTLSLLRNAISNKQLHIDYQPIINLKSGEMHKAEALVRWHHPEGEIIGPMEFIRFAEETGLIVSIGEWIFHTAIKQASLWRREYDTIFQLSLNTSAVQMKSDQHDVLNWINYLHEQNIANDMLIIEITESVLMDMSDTVDNKLNQLRNEQIAIAIDDFGTGFSSLSYLRCFAVDYLKIDSSFVENLESQTESRILCESMIVMAHKMGIRVVAEGIETREQLSILKDMDCDYGQGFFISPPLAVEKFEQCYFQH